MKKRIFSILMAAVMLLSVMFLFCGCSKKVVQIESLLKIDNNFSGTRTVNIIYPLDMKIDALKNKLLENAPKDENNRAVFSYEGVVEQGYKFTYTISFADKEQYTDTLCELLGREVCVALEFPDTVLLSGTRIYEDFSVDELVDWIKEIEDETDKVDSTEYSYISNLVNISGKIYSTENTVNICEVEGYPINSIDFETTNLKNDRYDRVITFDVPNNTYDKLSEELKDFFEENTDETASYSDWTSKGSSWQYQVIYKDLTIEELLQYTNMLLATEDSAVFYGDKTNSSTPLSEGMTFEESLSLLNFIGDGKKPVKVNYKYSLPTQTTHGDGLLLSNGAWKADGTWDKSTFTTSSDSELFNVRVHDGMQYEIEGINFTLESLGENDFIRTTEFLYSLSTGKDGCDYAFNYFLDKKAETTVYETNDHYVCKVTLKGSAREISSDLSELFSSSNNVKYTTNASAFSVTKSTEFVDNIDLAYMLTSENIEKPMSYTVTYKGNETVKSVSSGENIFSETAHKAENGKFTVSIEKGQGVVSYKGSIPNNESITVYIVVASCMTFVALVIIVVLLLKKKKMKNTETEKGAPVQTTTFNVSDLHKADKESQRVKREIDSEVQKKIDEQLEKERIEAIKAELRAKEFAELERKVSGNDKADGTDNAEN